MEQEEVVRHRCQRIGCNATFTEDDNPEGSCQYHDSPIFRDGMKEWSCCKKRSHDFTLFLEIPGCKTGKHTTEKPVLAKVTPSPKNPISPPAAVTTTNLSSKESCPRCKQGFFCSDHGSLAKQASPAKSYVGTEGSSAPSKKWKCCDVHVKEFDEFMSIPPCTKGWHNADLVTK
ncbi:hypothetical protein GH714_026748 [Hevea brasiliensis]|uniref:CHORD domain-containing protein n=1 Tax=Hevea brasiliensis TaxID=3981 RepID=A0A6A6MHF4_HEVBR|nr:hypothetical protein GH714_026748 [Hevea brasiliensis]